MVVAHRLMHGGECKHFRHPVALSGLLQFVGTVFARVIFMLRGSVKQTDMGVEGGLGRQGKRGSPLGGPDRDGDGSPFCQFLLYIRAGFS